MCGGCYEKEDSGLSRFGKEVIKEMNRIGMIIDMSHSGNQSILDAIEHSQRPIAITHAESLKFQKQPSAIKKILLLRLSLILVGFWD